MTIFKLLYFPPAKPKVRRRGRSIYITAKGRAYLRRIESNRKALA